MNEPDRSRIVRGILTSHPSEIGCTECFQQMDQYVDLLLAGRQPAELIPLVQDHLNRCPDCRDELETLLTALRGL